MGNYNSVEVEFPITIREEHWLREHVDNRDSYYDIADMIKGEVNDLDFSEKIHVYNNTDEDLRLDAVYSVCSALRYEYHRNFNKVIRPSVMFLYNQIKMLYSDFPNYKGAIAIRDVLKIIKKIGVCEDDKYVYSNSVPSMKTYNLAIEYSNLEYRRIERYSVKKTISMNYPVIFGFGIYEKFYDHINKDSILKYNGEEKLIGSRVGIICGIKKMNNAYYYIVILHNKGKVYIPVTYVNDYGGDFWIIESVKGPSDYKSSADIVRGYRIREDGDWDIDY